MLTAYGIETVVLPQSLHNPEVATVLTAYGIETGTLLHKPQKIKRCNSAYRLRY